MNIRLDTLIRGLIEDAGVRVMALADPAAAASRFRLSVADVKAAAAGDLRELNERGAHALLIMQLAGHLGIDPMAWIRQAKETQQQSEGATGNAGENNAEPT